MLIKVAMGIKKVIAATQIVSGGSGNIWDQNDVSDQRLILTNNLTVSKASLVTGWDSVRSLNPVGPNLVYFELTGNGAGLPSNAAIGFSNDASLSPYIAPGAGHAYAGSPLVPKSVGFALPCALLTMGTLLDASTKIGVATAPNFPAPSTTGQNVIGVAINNITKKVYMSLNGVWFRTGSNVLVADFATATSIFNITTLDPLYIMISLDVRAQLGSYTANFGATPFAQTIPAGYGVM